MNIPVLLLMKGLLHQLRLVVHTIVYQVLYIQGSVIPFKTKQLGLQMPLGFCQHILDVAILSSKKTWLAWKNHPSWWFQPIWKICSSNWIIFPGRGENKKCSKPPPSIHGNETFFFLAYIFVWLIFMVNVGKYTYQSHGCVMGGGLQVNEQDVSLLWPLFPRRGLNTLQNMIIPLASMYVYLPTFTIKIN